MFTWLALLAHLGEAEDNPQMYDVNLEFNAEAGRKYYLYYDWIGDGEFFLRVQILDENRNMLTKVESDHFDLKVQRLSLFPTQVMLMNSVLGLMGV